MSLLPAMITEDVLLLTASAVITGVEVLSVVLLLLSSLAESLVVWVSVGSSLSFSASALSPGTVEMAIRGTLLDDEVAMPGR